MWVAPSVPSFKPPWLHTQNQPTIHNVCMNGHTSLVRLLVTKYICDHNARDSNGENEQMEDAKVDEWVYSVRVHSCVMGCIHV